MGGNWKLVGKPGLILMYEDGYDAYVLLIFAVAFGTGDGWCGRNEG